MLDRETTAIDLTLRPLCSTSRRENNVTSLPFTIGWNSFTTIPNVFRRGRGSYFERLHQFAPSFSSVLIARPLCSLLAPARSNPIRPHPIPPAAVDPAVNEANAHASPVIFSRRAGDARNIPSSLCHRDRRSANKAERVGEMSLHTWARYGRPLRGRHCK